ncbi:MAG TPA: hypothetical protein VF885_21735, partial [Arthrobacter sp.]
MTAFRRRAQLAGQPGHARPVTAAITRAGTIRDDALAAMTRLSGQLTAALDQLSGLGTQLAAAADPEAAEALAELARRVESLIEKGKWPGVGFEAQLIGQRPAGEISAGHALIRLAQACLLEQGLQPNLTAGSTDANVPLSLGYPALVLGLTTGGGAHTLHEFIDTAPLE